jgi:hypothetical protein
MDITREQFEAQRHPRFGRANPERMIVPFWEYMVRSGRIAWTAREEFGAEEAEGPTWCFERFGMSRTELSDGRVVCVAGEHEDSYDCDFCIYNDVIVFEPGGGVSIFGYPRDVFPPMDFHTTTLVGDDLFVIGCVGYRDDRLEGQTPVYRVNCSTFRIDKVETHGEGPGWISRHQTNLDKAGEHLLVCGGKVQRSGCSRLQPNRKDFRLGLKDFRWERDIPDSVRRLLGPWPGHSERE